METLNVEVDKTVDVPPGIQYIEVVSSGFSQPADLRADAGQDYMDLTHATSEAYDTFCVSENGVLEATSPSGIVSLMEDPSDEVKPNPPPIIDTQGVFKTSPVLLSSPRPANIYVKTVMIDGHQQTLLVDGNDCQVQALPTDVDVVTMQNELPPAANSISLCNINGLEEPLYVNAKQYHRILKRREARLKLEQRHKIDKERSKFIYNSRHLHATKRVRGPGGKFLKRPVAEKETL